MKCSHCNQNEATTYIKRIVNGKKEEMHLCRECAEKLGVLDEFDFDPFTTDSLFGNLLGAGAAAFNSLTGIDRCGYCGSSFNDIVNSGKVGCAHCYEKFENKLAPSIEKLHGRTKHVGKNVTYYEDDVKEKVNKKSTENKLINKVDELKKELKQAVKEQRFEDAAVIRDKINAIIKED